MSTGYLDSPWPAEDAGSQRLQRPRIGAGLGLRPGEALRATTRRTLMSTMTVLGAPGEVYLLTHSALRAQVGLPTTACVEQIDPVTLKPLRRSPRLRGGPMWPGGMAIHRNGDLYVVYGRYAHRLNRRCVPLADAADHHALDVSGLAGGSNTNPPLVDVQRSIVVGYDSVNAVLQAWRFDAGLRTMTPLWRKAALACASHMILYADTGELVVNDYRRHGEEVVVLDIATGVERGRVRTGGLMQGVVFPSPGWGRDFYWSSMGRLARVCVA